jgi:Protein of unknown function (DUF2568)
VGFCVGSDTLRDLKKTTGRIFMVLKPINLGIAFLLELCMLAALAYWGFQTGSSLFLKIVLGIGAPVLAVVIWARFMAPKSQTRLTGSSYLVLKLILFGAAAMALAAAGQTTLAIIFAVVAVINQILLMVWQQETLADNPAASQE